MLGKPASSLFVDDWLISQEQVFKITAISPVGEMLNFHLDRPRPNGKDYAVFEPDSIITVPTTNPKFEVGTEVYVSSRYDGIVRRKVVAIIADGEDLFYGLDRSVQYHKDGLKMGAIALDVRLEDYSREQDESDMREVVRDGPAPEFCLMFLGDQIYSTMPMSAGPQDEVLTIEMVNLED